MGRQDNEWRAAGFAKVEKRVRTTAGGASGSVRNLRIREDTAKYLLNLDANSAHYDPKSRSMREDPQPNRPDTEKSFRGDNFVRQNGDYSVSSSPPHRLFLQDCLSASMRTACTPSACSSGISCSAMCLAEFTLQLCPVSPDPWLGLLVNSHSALCIQACPVKPFDCQHVPAAILSQHRGYRRPATLQQ